MIVTALIITATVLFFKEIGFIGVSVLLVAILVQYYMQHSN